MSDIPVTHSTATIDLARSISDGFRQLKHAPYAHPVLDKIAPIIWHKIANASLEAEGNGAPFMGKPYEPNGVIKNDIEFILMQRKPGGYRTPDLASRLLSVIPEACHREWFQQIWTGVT